MAWYDPTSAVQKIGATPGTTASSFFGGAWPGAASAKQYAEPDSYYTPYGSTPTTPVTGTAPKDRAGNTISADSTGTSSPASTTSSQWWDPGTLGVSGAGENYFDQHQADYTAPQANEQYWNGMAGNFQGTAKAAVHDAFAAPEAEQSRLLNAQAFAQGGSNSGANLRAHEKLAADTEAAEASALKDWTSLGGTLSSSAAGTKQAGLAMGTSASQGAENLDITRERGSITDATNLATSQATALQNGLTANQQDNLDVMLTELQAKVQSGQIDATTAANQAQQQMALAGVAVNAATSYYIGSKLKSPTTSTTSSSYPLVGG